jgi:hypothetical protein
LLALIRTDAQRVAKILAGLGLCCALTGCVEQVAELKIDDQRAAIRPSGLSPRPAAVALTQIEGAPEAVKASFTQFFGAEAAKRDVALTDSASARYLARGYLSAFPSEGGATITYVWDVYDRTNHRAQRLNDEIAIRGSAADPWTLVDEKAVAILAARSAGDIAAFLSNTPEAMAAAETGSPAAIAQHAQAAAPSPADVPLPGQALSLVETR